MPTLLIKNARVLVTQDAQGRQIFGGGLFVRDNVIEQVGKTEELPAVRIRSSMPETWRSYQAL